MCPAGQTLYRTSRVQAGSVDLCSKGHESAGKHLPLSSCHSPMPPLRMGASLLIGPRRSDIHVYSSCHGSASLQMVEMETFTVVLLVFSVQQLLKCCPCAYIQTRIGYLVSRNQDKSGHQCVISCGFVGRDKTCAAAGKGHDLLLYRMATTPTA